MRVGDGRAAAGDWVRRHAARLPGFRGAYLAGSTADRPATAELPPWSDVDVHVVLAGPVPPKPGKIRHMGVLLDVSHEPEASLADAGALASSPVLAPAFAAGRILLDPTGRLLALHEAVASTFAEPAAVRRRCEDVLAAIEKGMAALDAGAPWHEQVMAWMFPGTRVTHVVLVAALRNPTVRLRFPAARDVLRAHGMDALYRRFLEVLGCADLDRATVERHLDRLAVTFDETVPLARTPFFFSGDLTAAARPIAVDGSRRLVEDGDHREAVFWIVATAARCQQVLAADAPPLARDGAKRFRDTADALLGLRDAAGLRDRTAAVRALLPEVEAAAATIGGYA